jgi:hypothetical protein
MNWNQKTIKEILALRAKALGIRMPQAQNLLAQERFIARLARIEFGTKFIWKWIGTVKMTLTVDIR